MNKQIIGWGLMPCLHCGTPVNMEKGIHLCNAPERRWIKDQKEVLIELEDGAVWDLKRRKIVERAVLKKWGDYL